MKRAVILVNLGSPVAPEPRAIRQFLGNFLSDPRVVEIPRLLWIPLLYGVILPIRSKRVAHLYETIWTPDGSPLVAMTHRQAALLNAACAGDGFPQTVIEVAMVYGKPSIADAVAGLRQRGYEKILVLPLYPQYSGTTTAAIYDQVARINLQTRYVPDISIIREYCYRPDYLRALASSIIRHRKQKGDADLLLFSFHGIPRACVDKGDPYYQQCLDTAQAVANSLGLAPGSWKVSFQSRFGRAEWLQPYTDEMLAALPGQGVRSVDVICPAFVSDCLETLEEIEVGSRKIFLQAGGESFRRIPCLNDDEEHIAVLKAIIRDAGF